MPKDNEELEVVETEVEEVETEVEEVETETETETEVEAGAAEVEALRAQVGELQGKFDGVQAKEVLEVAASAGIMPELIGEKDAKGFGDLLNAEKQVKALKRMIRRDEESYQVGEKEYTKGQLVDLLEQWEDAQADLSEQFGEKLKTHRKDTVAVFRLGMEAKRAGWVPGKKESVRTAPAKKVVPKKKGAVPRDAGGAPDFSKVTSNDDLVNIIAKEYE
jgi:hypothetical protein